MDDPRPIEDLRAEAMRPSDNLLASDELHPSEDLRPMGDLRVNGAQDLEPSATPKIMGAVVVALGVAALGAYTLSTGMWNSPSPPRMVASAEPAPVKITAPVAPLTPAPAPVSAPTSPYGHTADTTTAKPPSRVAHVRKSAAPVTNDSPASAPSVPAEAATPATTPAPAPEPAPTPSTNAEPAAPAQPGGQP